MSTIADIKKALSIIAFGFIHDIKSSVKQAKSQKITIANYDELYEYAIKFYSMHQWSMKITDGVITDINNFTNLIKKR